ncbi:hypothetical protein TELCIR_14286, partial [Teladorsagia circumcincta]
DFAQNTLGNFSYAIPFMVALLLIGTLNSNLFCGSRFMHAAAREGHLPTCMSCRHEASNSPRAALLGQMICTVAMSFIDIDTLINYVTFVMWSQKVVTVTFTGVAVVASGLVVFYALVKPKEAPRTLQVLDDMATRFTCRLLNCRPDSKKINKEVICWNGHVVSLSF